MSAVERAVRVVGLTFRPGYPETVLRVADSMESTRIDSVREASSWDDIGALPEGPTVLLIRNPDNEYDGNAIEVHIPMLGRRGFVGHIPKELAARWAPRLDAGQIAQATVMSIPVTPDHIDRPGLEIGVLLHEPGCPADPCTCNERTP